MKKFPAVLVFATAMTAIFSNQVQAQTDRYIIVITKTAYELKVYKDIVDDAHWQATYAAVFGSGGLGPKKIQGDNLTPEGVYHIIKKQDLSYRSPAKNWHKSLELDYSNNGDQRHNLAGIWIHGVPPDHPGDKKIPGELYEFDNDVNRKRNWTWGCVSLKNDDVDDLYSYIPIGTEVRIVHGPE